MKAFWILVVLSVLLISCNDTQKNGSVDMATDNSLLEELKLLHDKRIFFGHQSVGADIVNGLHDLNAATNGPRLNLVRLTDSSAPNDPFFGDALVGKNAEPSSKCDAFAQYLDSLANDSLDIALMKFCYVDIKYDTDVDAMFDYYATVMEQVKTRHPNVAFVHVTAPVTMRTKWWRRVAKQVLGRDDVWDLGSIKVHEFNTRLRERYKAEPIFDLAQIESTYPDGSRNSFEYRGKTAYSLVGDYTFDGGHLNEVGRKIVARELVRTLAAVVRGGAQP